MPRVSSSTSPPCNGGWTSRTAASPLAGSLPGGPVADRPEIEHRWVRRALSAHARPGRSAALQDYVGSPLPTLAVPAPDLHRIVGEFRRRNGPRTSAELRPLLERLWSGRRSRNALSRSSFSTGTWKRTTGRRGDWPDPGWTRRRGGDSATASPPDRLRAWWRTNRGG